MTLIKIEHQTVFILELLVENVDQSELEELFAQAVSIEYFLRKEVV